MDCVCSRDVPIGGMGGIRPPMSMKLQDVGPTAGTLACIGKFDQIST